MSNVAYLAFCVDKVLFRRVLTSTSISHCMAVTQLYSNQYHLMVTCTLFYPFSAGGCPPPGVHMLLFSPLVRLTDAQSKWCWFMLAYISQHPVQVFRDHFWVPFSKCERPGPWLSIGIHTPPLWIRLPHHFIPGLVAGVYTRFVFYQLSRGWVVLH